jgi:hypothetical protein
VVDVDRDGLNDIVVAERSSAPSLVWLRRDQNGWTRFLIDEAKAPIAAGGTFGDVDGDGDPDVIFGSSGHGSHVWWWENPGPAGDPRQPWQRHEITSTQKGQHHDQLAGDFLGQGRTQVVSWYQGGGELSLFVPGKDPRQTASWTALTVAGELKQAEGLAAGDIDGDRRIDIASGSHVYRNPGGDMTKTPWPSVTLPNEPVSGNPLDAGLLFNVKGAGPARDIIAQSLPNIVWLHAGDAKGEKWSTRVVAQMPTDSTASPSTT